MFAHVSLFQPPYSPLTYSLPAVFPDAFWQPGLRVLAPVGKTLRSGFISGLSQESGLPASVKCREILWPMEAAPIVNSQLLALANDLALRQGLTIGHVLGQTLPAGLRKNKFKIIWLSEQKKRVLEANDVALLDSVERDKLAQAILSGEAIFAASTLDLAELEIFSVACDPPWPLRPAAKRQIEIMDLLYERGNVSRKQIMLSLGPGAAAPLQKLVAAGLVNIKTGSGKEADQPLLPPPDPEFELNAEQKLALADLKTVLTSSQAEIRLLYGITGSGKTAVYLELMRACIAMERSALLLAPEVALAHKLYRDVVKGLPNLPCFLYHGYQHPAQRENIFSQIGRQKEPCIIVGTRSALFLPLPDPGCIILDEEHDASYKQDEGLVYHAKELAWLRARQGNGLLVLGSATPDIRSFYAGATGKLPILTLNKRATGGDLPPVELVQIGKSAGIAAAPNEAGLLSRACEDALRECLNRKEQAIILLNRRGYSPLIYCLECEKTLHCPNCQIGLAWHKGYQRLVCHYCGYSLPWPGPCPDCGATNYITVGEGTERLAERLEEIAGQPILRLDRDNARRAERIQEILEAFSQGESPFLVGTQMLSKGHHFPNVTLAIVADGDIGLNLPDYRAAERSFQLLAQSAGRAGRGCKPGIAMIQTRKTDHYCWQHIQKYDYKGFYDVELGLRRKYSYPPFTRLGLLRISFPITEESGPTVCNSLGQELRKQAKELKVRLLGPAPAPLAILNGRKRFQCLIKGQDWQPMRELWFFASKHKAAKILRISLDLDPVNML